MIESITSEEIESRTWEVCVVGSGPVGVSLALELERLGHEVLMLEAGSEQQNDAAVEASRAIITEEHRHAAMQIAVCRAFGGTSWTWGGRCVPYDDVDWMPRAFVQDTAWPIPHSEVRPHYARAVEYLLCGSGDFTASPLHPLTDSLSMDELERWSRDARLMHEHHDRLLQSRQVHIALQATVVGMNFSSGSGNVASLQVATPAGPRTVKAQRYVLAMGGVETARLLLAVQRTAPALFGGADGPLGRYYMGHISGKIASIVFADPAMIHDFDFYLDHGSFCRRRLMLTAEAQMQHKLLNTAFWPDNPPFYDAGHRSGVLSAVFLALAFPPTGRRLLPEAIRLAHTGPRPYPWAAHLRNVLLGAPQSVQDIYRILRDRFLRRPRKPGFLVPNRSGRYALHYHAEQAPMAESRITISSETDACGMPRAVIDLRFSAQDVASVIASHRLLDKELRDSGLARLEFWHPEQELAAAVDAQASDGFHQIGSTRMGTNPAASVVDKELRVHGLANLYIASSSVFPTSGQANSTLLAVAFAVRLAGHIHSQPTAQAQ